MIKKLKNTDPIPDWFDDELAKTPIPSNETLSQYDYLKEDFINALRKATAKKSSKSSVGEKTADVILSLAGKVLYKVKEIIEESIPQPTLVPIATRGAGSTDTDELDDRVSEKVVARLSKLSGKDSIELKEIVINGTTEIELNLTSKESGIDIRPFSVKVNDESGNELAPLTTIPVGAMPPRFPGVNAGFYVFLISWDNGKEELSIDLQK